MTPTDREAIADAIVLTLKAVLAPRDATVTALGQRIAALEKKPHVRFAGTWAAGKSYAPGDAVVKAGGLWIAKKATSGTPGVDFDDWQLAVKKGSADAAR